MMLIMMFILGSVVLLYFLLPNLYARHCSPRVIRKLPDSPTQIALTFDDGPDPLYTPRLLDLLRAMEVKASFFLVAERAWHNPDLVRRIVYDGHDVGLHSLSHRPAWLFSPRQTWLDLARSVMIFKELDLPVVFYRPPWGLFNLCTQLFSSRQGLKTILWNVEAHDWSRQASVESISAALAGKVKAAAVILLHDSGGAPEAPGRTLQALQEIIPQFKQKGLEFVTLSRGLGLEKTPSGGKMLIGKLIKSMDRRLVNHTEWKVLNSSPDRLLRVDVYPYRGTSLAISPQVSLERGDMMAELHINNQVVPAHLPPRKILVLLRRELDALAASVQTEESLRQVKVVYALTLFHPWLLREGFTVRPLEGRIRRWALSGWENLLRQSYTGKDTAGWREARECWISREKLMQRTAG